MQKYQLRWSIHNASREFQYLKMSNKRLASRPTREILKTISIWCCLLHTTAAAPNPQNFFNEAAAGALGVASQVAEFLQNGVAARKDFAFQIPGFGMHSRSEIGMGEAILRRTQSSEEDSDEDGRRRRRAVSSEEYGTIGGTKTPFKKLLRNMHAPCYSGGNGGGGNGGGDDGENGDIVEEARRRIARMKARKAAQAKKAKNKKSKKSKGRRKKRQSEFEDLSESEVAEWRERLNQHIQLFTEKMSRFYENISAAMMGVMKRKAENVEGDD